MKQDRLFAFAPERPKPVKPIDPRPFLERLGFTHLSTDKRRGSHFELRVNDRLRVHVPVDDGFVLIGRRDIADYYVVLETCDPQVVAHEVAKWKVNRSDRPSPQLPPMPPAARAGWGPSPL